MRGEEKAGGGDEEKGKKRERVRRTGLNIRTPKGGYPENETGKEEKERERERILEFVSQVERRKKEP